jgi:hypothetical protein
VGGEAPALTEGRRTIVQDSPGPLQINDVVIKTKAGKTTAGLEDKAMKAIRVLVGKVGFTAVGVGVGLILAAGSGVAAVHLTKSMATEHAINVVQAASSHDGLTKDSNVSGADDRIPEAAEPEAGDDSSSRPASTDDSAQRSSHTTAPAGTPEPGDDRGRGTSAEPGDDKGRGGNH